MKDKIFLLFCFLCFSKAFSQNNPIFNGGNNDGVDKTNFTQNGNNIFLGGTNDGINIASFAQASINLFTGGVAGGFAITTFIQASNNIFTGGNSDGWNAANFLQAANNIFGGGNGDGWNNTKYMQLGNNIFAGGNSDGWAEAYYKPTVTLPVRFILFSVSKKDNITSILAWKTASETNSAYFEVQRGTDAMQFSTIGKVDANQNSNEIIEYSFTDKAPLKGLNYYRLKQVDIDGKYNYTPARALNFENLDSKSVKYYPNPTNGILNIEINENLKEAKIINVFNTLGIVINHLIINELDKKIVAIDLSNYPKGIYFIHLKSATINSTHRVVLQ